MTPMCPPGGTYSRGWTLTLATDLAFGRSAAGCVASIGASERQETQRPETRDKDPETQRPETSRTPVTTNQVRGTITLGGTISACGPRTLTCVRLLITSS